MSKKATHSLGTSFRRAALVGRRRDASIFQISANLKLGRGYGYLY